MSLPKLTAPIFTLTVPSTQQVIKYRPFLVKEEKNLLIAQESKDMETIMNAMKDTINSCVLEEKFDISKLASFDFEYLFLNIRAKSVGEQIKLNYRHSGGKNYKDEECKEVTEVELNIEDIKVQGLENHSCKVMINDDMGIMFRYPRFSDMKVLSNDDTADIELIASCIETVFDNENVYDPDNLEDSIQFVQSLNVGSLEKVVEFFKTIPALKHSFEYTCKKCGQKDSVTLEGIGDFF